MVGIRLVEHGSDGALLLIDLGTEPGAGGVGLHLARQLSLDVGWYRTESVKTVWATFSV